MSTKLSAQFRLNQDPTSNQVSSSNETLHMSRIQYTPGYPSLDIPNIPLNPLSLTKTKCYMKKSSTLKKSSSHFILMKLIGKSEWSKCWLWSESNQIFIELMGKVNVFTMKHATLTDKCVGEGEHLNLLKLNLVNGTSFLFSFLDKSTLQEFVEDDYGSVQDSVCRS